MYICFVQEFQEPWTYWHVFFTILLSPWYPCFIIPIICILCSILLPYHLIYFVSFHSSSTDLSHFIAWSMVISPLTSHPMDSGLEILSWEGYLVSKSLQHCLRVIHVIMYSHWSPCIDIKIMRTKKKKKKKLSMWLCILNGARVLFQIMHKKRKKKEKRKKKVTMSLCILIGAHVLI